MKNLFLLLAIVYSGCLFSQSDSTKVAFIAYWSKGDSYDFKVSKLKRTWKNDSLVKADSTKYMANFKVLDSTDTSYRIKWTITKDLSNSLLQNSEALFDDKETFKKIIQKHNVQHIIYTTDEVGEFTGIENWKELSDLTVEMVNELIQNLKVKKPDKAEQLENAMAPLIQIYATKEGVEQLVYPELKVFHFPMGYEYYIDEPIDFEQEYPNLFGGDPVKGQSTISFEDHDYDESYIVVKEESQINEDDAMNMILSLFKKMQLPEEKFKEAMQNARLNISDLNYYQYYYNPGIPHRVYTSREIIIEVEGEQQSKLQETEIELIYEE